MPNMPGRNAGFVPVEGPAPSDDDDDDVPVPVADRPKEILPLGFPATIPECTEIRFFASGGRDDDGGPCGVNVVCRA